MIRVDQRRVDGRERGDCLTACIASLLELPIEVVPVFIDAGGDLEMWEACEAFLLSFGLSAVCHLPEDVDPEDEVVAIGAGPRGKAHAVLFSGGALLHDPHPSRAGLTGWPWMVIRLEKIDG